MSNKPLGVGVIGCGAISGNYLKFAKLFPAIKIVALADLMPERAQQQAKEFGVPRTHGTPDELLRDDEVEIVLNLTIPAVHHSVSKAILNAGKHVWTEKPLAIKLEEGLELYKLAKAKNLRLGGAPDTFLGAGHQTARKLIDDGAIGKPLAATAFMLCRGHESWHPSPEFYYKVGGGPMFDMGPYYLTALLNMFGPIKRIQGMASIAINPRTITHKNKDGGPGPLFGKAIHVETPDHVAGTIEFQSGVIATIVTSFATAHRPFDVTQPISVFGTDGTLQVPDPNGFDGAVKLAKLGETEFKEVPFTHTLGYGRAVGAADMAMAIRTNRPHRGSAELVTSCLDAMAGFLKSSETGQAHTMTVPFDRPAALPAGLPLGEIP
ncbi:MAG: Gfo/Idh/MocA family oxidoreductase [Phycisphaeraceae bacterium]|nr:Gfo/Idh/MocA family oxidoreductase [Phycisphaeraceae bacterium]